MKSIFAFLLLFFVTSSSGQSLSCTYTLLPGVPYTCTLSINNPDGLDNFMSIGGVHASGRGNSDVLRVISAYGNTKNIPEVICRQFPNLEDLQFDNSSIQILTNAAFRNCANLKQLIVVKNSINELPVNLFDGAPNLEILHLYENSISVLPSGIFNTLNNLKTLSLNGNTQIQLPSDIFETLTTLEILQLFYCRISALEPRWFVNLSSLRILKLQDNAIEDIPNGIFVNSPNLLEMQFQRNQLSEIRAASFPDAMRNLNRVLFHENQIASIDPFFFDRSPNLFAAIFSDNICVNKNVSQFSVNREESLLHFIDCFEAFNPPAARCQIYYHQTYGFTCELFNVTYRYFSRSFTIQVDHGNLTTSDADVTGLIFTSSSLEKVPPQIFETFTNLEYLQVRQVGLSEVKYGTFEGCVNSLKFIDASYNCMKEIGGDAFTECQNVEDIRLNHNCIYSIKPCKTFFVNKLQRLDELNLKHNVCVDESYESINVSVKEDMKVDMRGCFGMWFD